MYTNRLEVQTRNRLLSTSRSLGHPLPHPPLMSYYYYYCTPHYNTIQSYVIAPVIFSSRRFRRKLQTRFNVYDHCAKPINRLRVKRVYHVYFHRFYDWRTKEIFDKTFPRNIRCCTRLTVSKMTPVSSATRYVFSFYQIHLKLIFKYFVT